MSQQPFERQEGSPLPTQIYEGMLVYDRTRHKIGTVECVYRGAISEEASQHGGGPATASSPGGSENSLIEDFAKASAPKIGSLRRCVNVYCVRVLSGSTAPAFSLPIAMRCQIRSRASPATTSCSVRPATNC